MTRNRTCLALGLALLSLCLMTSTAARAGDKADKRRARREERRKKKEAEKARREAERKKKEAEEAESGKPPEAGDKPGEKDGDKDGKVAGKDGEAGDRPDYRENDHAHVATEGSRDLVWIKLSTMQRAALTRKRKVGRKLVRRGQRDEDKQAEARAPIQLTVTQLKAISHATRIKRSWPRKVLLYVHLESLRKKPGDKHTLYVVRPVAQFRQQSPGDPTPK